MRLPSELKVKCSTVCGNGRHFNFPTDFNALTTYVSAGKPLSSHIRAGLEISLPNRRKRIQRLKKKLKEIKELELRDISELNPDQRRKMKRKAELTQELKELLQK